MYMFVLALRTEAVSATCTMHCRQQEVGGYQKSVVHAQTDYLL